MMAKMYRLTRVLLLVSLALSLAACDTGSPSTSGVGQGQSTPVAGTPGEGTAPAPGGSGAMTEVGTPRSETLIVQTFDGKNDNPENMNPLSGSYAVWRGFRELAWGYLWEMDTATGKSYPELAADLPKVLNDNYTQFEV